MNTERSSDPAGPQNQLRQGQHLRSVPSLVEALLSEDGQDLSDLIMFKRLSGVTGNEYGLALEQMGFTRGGKTEKGSDQYAQTLAVSVPREEQNSAVTYTNLRIRVLLNRLMRPNGTVIHARQPSTIDTFAYGALVFLTLLRPSDDGSGKFVVAVNGRQRRVFWKASGLATPAQLALPNYIDPAQAREVMNMLTTALAKVIHRFQKPVRSVQNFRNVARTLGFRDYD